MNRMDDPLKVVTDLKPCLLEQLAEDGYARHGDRDLARLTAEGYLPVPGEQRKVPAGSGWSRRYLLTAGIAVTAAAAAAAALVAVGSLGGMRHRPPGLAAVPGRAASVRSFLLASAQIAAHAPSTTGTYWYIKERDVEPTTAATKVGKPPSMHKLRKSLLPGITYVATEESWTGQDHGRTVVDENLAFHFASAADKARWEEAGKPPLATAAGTSTKPTTSNYDMTYYWGYGARRLTMKRVEALPRTAAGLNKTLRRMWMSTPDKSAATGRPDPTYGDYLIQWAGQLFTGPASPGTRAAMYRLLAQQPGIRIVDAVTDPLGRVGVGVTDGGEDFLVIDPRTATELATSSAPVQADSAMAMTRGVSVMEAMGWTNQLGAVPQP